MHITGVPESEFRKIGIDKFISSPSREPSRGRNGYPLQIKNCKTNKVFECGTFEVKSISDLKSACKKLGDFSPKNICKFVIVTAEDPENDVNNIQNYLITTFHY